ncbi:MAG: metallopeptidase family protein [bacterium]
MDSQQFQQLVENALHELPGWVDNIIEQENLVICVRETPGPKVVEEHSSEILGLFTGVPYGGRRGTNPLPSRIEIYRQPFLKHIPADEMPEQVRRTVIHEVAHFMGMDENEVRDRGY